MPISAQSLPVITTTSVAWQQCGEPTDIKLVEPHPTASREDKRKELEISRLYLGLAHECFNKAAKTEHAEAADAFREMGRRYITAAAVLQRSAL
jgi:hypothetical protein